MTPERTEYANTPLTFTRPDRDPRAGLVVVQEAWGVTDRLAQITATLAGEGYLAAAPHLYHRSGDHRSGAPVVEGHDFAKARPLLSRLRGDEIAEDIAAAIAWLREQGCGRVGIIGFCMGGTIAFWAAAHADVDAAVTFYGAGIAESRWPGIESGLATAPKLRVPWLGVYGDKDRSIPVAQVERLRTVLESVNVPTRIVRYSRAGHAFATDPATPGYVADAAEDAWMSAREFLGAHLG